MLVDRYVGLDPPALLQLERELDAAADELQAMRMEIETTLASVGRSWSSGTTVRAAEDWLRTEARDVHRRLDEIEAANPFWSALHDPYLAPLAGIGLGTHSLWKKDRRDCGQLRDDIEDRYIHDLRGRFFQLLEDANHWRETRNPKYQTHIDKLLQSQVNARELLFLWDINGCAQQDVGPLPVDVRKWATDDLLREIPPPLKAVHHGGIHWGHILKDVGIAAGAVATGTAIALTLPEDAAGVGIVTGTAAVAHAVG